MKISPFLVNVTENSMPYVLMNFSGIICMYFLFLLLYQTPLTEKVSSFPLTG